MASRLATRLMNICLASLCRARCLDMAEITLIDGIRLGSLPDVVTYNTLISAYSHLVGLEEAYSIISRMREAGLQPDTVSYNSLLAAAARRRLLSYSLSLLDEMSRQGIIPDLCTYNNLLHCLFLSHRPELVPRVLAAMEAANLSPSSTTYNILLNGLCKSGDFNSALKLLRRLKISDGSNSTVLVGYNTLIDSLGKSGRVKQARSLFRELVGSGIVPNAITLTTMMKSLFRKGRFKEGLSLAEEFESGFFRQDAFVYCTAVAALIKIGRLEEASRILNEMDKFLILDTACCNVRIDLCFKQGDVEAALDLLEKLREIDDYTVSIVVNGLCRNDRIAEAHRFLMRSSPNLVAFNCFIQALCRRGSVDLAMGVFNSLEKKDSFTYTALLRGLAKNGKFLEASMVMVSGLREGVQLSRSVRRLVLAGLRFLRSGVHARRLRWEIVKNKFRLS